MLREDACVQATKGTSLSLSAEQGCGKQPPHGPRHPEHPMGSRLPSCGLLTPLPGCVRVGSASAPCRGGSRPPCTRPAAGPVHVAIVVYSFQMKIN